MVRNTRFFVMAASAALFVSAAAAQSKVAIISMQQAILQTAEIKKASADLEAKYKPRQDAIEKMRAQIADLQQKLQSPNLTPQQQNDLTLQGQRTQRDLDRATQDLQEEVDNVRNDILTKAGQRMSEVVKKLAEERGIDVIVEAGSTLYVKPELDLTKDATAAYDKAYPVAAPAAAPAK
jgi:outer membrane protein